MADFQNDKFRDECGVFGYFSKTNEQSVGQYAYYSLFSLQHRGQDSTGIFISDGKEIKGKKDIGTVSVVFKDEEKLSNFKGKIAIGHARYSTSGSTGAINAQPIIGKTRYGKIAIAHNGHFINNKILREELTDAGSIFQTSSDTESILVLIAKSKEKTLGGAVKESLKKVIGSYSLIVMGENSIHVARDSNGIRPLCIGKKDEDFVFASETCGLEAIGAKYLRDVECGEVISIVDGEFSSSFLDTTGKRKAHCAFEYIYFARNDSTLDGTSVYKSRIRLGVELGKESNIDADIVIGVPDSGITSAIGFSEKTGILYGEGFVKNRYIGRTFISPNQELREQSVAVKLSPLRATVEGKRVIVIDDSIVRGTTSKNLVTLLKSKGAKEVHFRVSSPKVFNPCYFGINTPRKKELICNQKTEEEIKKYIGADSLKFLSLEGMFTALKGTKENRCFGCFKKEGYPFEIPPYA